ncbi:hypothetical protein JCM9279_006676 [Rhodotorula babjevae]
MPAPPYDSSDEDLPPPSSLFNPAPPRAASTIASSTRPCPPLDAPARRSSPRHKPPPASIQPASARSTADATAPRPPSSFIAPASTTPALVPTALAGRAAPAEINDEDLEERERHRRLAEELFPPSPPRAPPASGDAPTTAPRTSSPTTALDRPAQRTRARDASPDLISDSEAERSTAVAAAGSASAVKVGRRAHKGRRTSGAVYGLSDSSEDEGELAARMHDLGLSSRPSTSTNPAATALSTRSNSPPARPAATPKTTKTPRARRRITISIASSSSSSSSSSEDEYLPSPAATPRAGAKKTGQSSWREEQEEILAACTDDEDVEVAARRLPEDVQEFDGVLVYDPTPKKRPVKVATPRTSAFSPMPSSSRAATATPSKAGGGEDKKKVGQARSSLRTEVDLAGSSSDEDLPPPPFMTRLVPSTSSQRTPARAPRLAAPPKPTPRARTDPAPSTSSSSTTTLTAAQRSSLPIALIRDLDRSVFRCTWNGQRRTSESGGKGLPDGIEVVWNKRLRNTAGRASWKSTRTTLPSPTAGSPPIRTQTHHALVELSTHVTDTADKLKHTLAHELCHLAAWALSGEMKPPHGAAFKLWASRVMVVRPDIEVTTTHSYEIKYRFRWQCLSAVCGKIFGRHSNSINPTTHGCPCGSRLVALDKDGNAKLAPGSSSATGKGGAAPETPRTKSKWQEFMQTESPRVRADHPGVPQSEVLKLVAERWRLAKAVAASSSSSVSSASSTVEPARPAVAVEDSLAALSLS